MLANDLMASVMNQNALNDIQSRVSVEILAILFLHVFLLKKLGLILRTPMKKTTGRIIKGCKNAHLNSSC